jgi:divalent metal cation (Fe/Co/Zn/Cd) transporter
LFGEIIDESPLGHWQTEIEAITLAVPNVTRVEKYLIRKTGFEYFVDLYMRVPDALTITEGHAIAHTVKVAIQRQKPAIYNVLIHVEPD